ncbi:hypothetical protein Cgig2_023582 [Carnegiea gigantea]|uniref:At3g05675-like ankyrin-like domain-containing protein n=1 Tax=Carnegiea gigantea TaxID=171969 RepID=A0A9Q1JQR6_9CARY|nr:hypothetical protein Cgig2_023582 [Carnegiea gigantea]
MAMGMAYYQMQRNKQHQQPSFLNSIFMSTLNMATKMLLSFTSSYSFNNANIIINQNNNLKTKLKEHLRFMLLLLTWFSVWAFRLASDFFPSLSPLAATLKLPAPPFKESQQGQVQPRRTSYPAPDDHGGAGDASSALGSSLVPYSAYSSPTQNFDLIAHDGFLMEMDGPDGVTHDGQSVQALGRALSHVLALLKELPVTSRKYEFAMAMADRILDENTRDGQVELLHVNRVALSTAFESTISLLYTILNNAAISHANHQANTRGPWTTRLIKKLPLGSYINAYMKGGLSALVPTLDLMWQLKKRRVLSSPNQGDEFEHVGHDHSTEVLEAEKMTQELMWIINKLRACCAVDEALVQWSHASGLASLSLNANPRVQAFLIKISASLLGDIARAEYQVPTQVQYRLLVLWLPLFCYASNGLRYPVLPSYEKIEVERTIDRMIRTLPAMEQEVVLRNWLQDYAICSSDWPNLRPSYDRWCQSSRQLVS